MKYDIAVVFTIYNKKLESIIHRIDIDDSGDDGIVFIFVDNTDNGCNANCKSTEPHIYLPLGKNYGIAYGQNIGIKYCLDYLNVTEIVFFDQDTIICKREIRKMSDRRRLFEADVVAPIFVDRRYNFIYPQIRIGRNGSRHRLSYKELNRGACTNVVISSGSMTDIEIFKEGFFFEEELFIDYVDTEWCLRISSKGYCIRILNDIQMYHSIGDKIISLMNFHVPVHSPYRRYYRIRNSFLLLDKPHIPLLLSLREILFSLIHQLILILFSDTKLLYLKLGLLGIWHGMSKRSGWLNPKTLRICKL